MPSNHYNIEVVATKIDFIQQDLAEIKAKLDAQYITNDQFEPVKKIVYGMVSVVLLAVIGAGITLVIK